MGYQPLKECEIMPVKKTPKEQRINKKKSNIQRILIGSALSITMIWMFTLGLLVGKNVFPLRFNINEIQNEWETLRQISIQKRDSLIKHSYDLCTKKGLDFYKALRDDKDVNLLSKSDLYGSKKFKHLEKKSLAKKERLVASNKPKLQLKTKIKSKKSAKIRTKLTAKSKNKYLTLQVAAHQNPRMAVAAVKKFKEKGYPAYSTSIKLPEKGVWYRVRIGTFKNKTDADKMRKKLNMEKITAIIVPYRVSGESGLKIAQETHKQPES
ncbi:putative SPOR domain-containing protein [Candidatus Magnetomoraceae bacterium gMMP-15]